MEDHLKIIESLRDENKRLELLNSNLNNRLESQIEFNKKLIIDNIKLNISKNSIRSKL